MCNNKDIESKNSKKYLGVTFDRHFSGLSTASLMLKNKTNAELKFLYRNMYFGFKERKLLVSS